ncbi:hypothetical protein [Pseudoalteromonas luteoviolacea]|uniref:hypothetical protein n=1 Tax=Pseudoalteromonas luteoviolacea TaxID=43657 RepID=UPI001364A8FC|nr:hypothetical protein [Pseudoalteromonas luteoviolacea]
MSSKLSSLNKVHFEGQYTMSDITNAFGGHYVTVSRAVAQCKIVPRYALISMD